MTTSPSVSPSPTNQSTPVMPNKQELNPVSSHQPASSDKPPPISSANTTTSLLQQKTKQTTIIGIILGLIFSVTVIVLITFTTNKANQIQQTKQQISAKISDQANLQLSAEYIAQSQSQFEYLLNALPNEDLMVDFVSTLEAVTKQSASTSSLQFSSVAPVSSGPDKFLPFIAKLTTNQANFEDYLTKIEKMTYIIEIISIQAKNIDRAQDVWEYTISARVYVRDPFAT